MYGVECRVRLLLVCVQCSVQSEILNGVCKVYMQSEAVIGVCTVHGAE